MFKHTYLSRYLPLTLKIQEPILPNNAIKKAGRKFQDTFNKSPADEYTTISKRFTSGLAPYNFYKLDKRFPSRRRKLQVQ